MSLIGSHRGNVIGPQGGVGGAAPGNAPGGAPAAAVVNHPAVAQGAANAGPAGPPPALPTLAAFKAATRLDGQLSKLIDVRSSELKAVDQAVGKLSARLGAAPNLSDAAFLAAFKQLKQEKAALDGAVQTWDPANHTRGAKVTAQIAPLNTAFNAAQARYDQLISQNPVGNAVAFARDYGAQHDIMRAIASSAPNAMSALQDFSAVMSEARIARDDPALSSAQRLNLDAMVADGFTRSNDIAANYNPAAQGQPANGNTGAHAAARAANGGAALQAHINNHPTDLNATNDVGHTPLTVAILCHGTTSIIQDLLANHADVNAASLFGTFTTLDLARATNRSAVLPDLLNAGATSGVDPQTLKPSTTQNMATVDVLMLGSLSQDAHSTVFLQDAYNNIMGEGRLSPLLDLAAQKMVGDPANHDKALRINHVAMSDTRLLTGMPGAGAYNADTNTLNLASKDSQKSVQGTIVHELTHHAVQEIWNNDDMPFPKTDLTTAQGGRSIAGTLMETYLNAIQTDLGRVATGDAGAGVREVVLNRVGSGYAARGTILDLPQGQMSTAMLQEYVVGIPQAINDFGYAAVQANTPNLLAFYENRVLPQVDQMVQALSQRTTP